MARDLLEAKGMPLVLASKLLPHGICYSICVGVSSNVRATKTLAYLARYDKIPWGSDLQRVAPAIAFAIVLDRTFVRVDYRQRKGEARRLRLNFARASSPADPGSSGAGTRAYEPDQGQVRPM